MKQFMKDNFIDTAIKDFKTLKDIQEGLEYRLI
jgi:hypothetical protein